VPGQLLSSPACTVARPLERLAVGEKLVDRGRETRDVAWRHDAAGPELAYRLRDPADVVGHGRNAGAERAQQGAALVELGPVREDGDGGLAEGVVDLGLREIAEPPLDVEDVRGGAILTDRLHQVARH